MANIRSKKNHFYLEFYDPKRRPRQKWVTLRTKDRVAARARAVELERAHARGEYDPWQQAAPQGGRGLDEAAAAYLKVRERLRLSPATLRGDRTTLARFRSLAGAAPVDAVDQASVQRFVEHLLDDGCEPGTIRTYVARLHGFFAWCVAGGFLPGNPVQGAARPRVGKSCARHFEPDELERLVRRIRSVQRDAWLADMVEVAVATGMRLSELCAMRWSWLNLAAAAVEVRREADYRPKSHHERHIPVGREVVAVLARRKEQAGTRSERVFTLMTGGPIKPDYASKRFKRYVREEGLAEELTFHSLRHSYASWLVQAGAGLYEVKQLLGHSSVETTQQYAHLAPKTLRRAVERVF